jgi:LacI family transcriptional regulator
MGFDDVLPAEVATPSITTIRQPLKEMGCEAAERVVQAIRRGPGKPERDRLHMPCPELVVRMSTAGPPAELKPMQLLSAVDARPLRKRLAKV